MMPTAVTEVLVASNVKSTDLLLGKQSARKRSVDRDEEVESGEVCGCEECVERDILLGNTLRKQSNCNNFGKAPSRASCHQFRSGRGLMLPAIRSRTGPRHGELEECKHQKLWMTWTNAA